MDLQLVQSTLEGKYCVIDVGETSTDEGLPLGHSLDDEDFWTVLDDNERSHNIGSSISQEIEHYLKYPRARKSANAI